MYKVAIHCLMICLFSIGQFLLSSLKLESFVFTEKGVVWMRNNHSPIGWLVCSEIVLCVHIIELIFVDVIEIHELLHVELDHLSIDHCSNSDEAENGLHNNHGRHDAVYHSLKRQYQHVIVEKHKKNDWKLKYNC